MPKGGAAGAGGDLVVVPEAVQTLRSAELGTS
jgi:hypothetical protein